MGNVVDEFRPVTEGINGRESFSGVSGEISTGLYTRYCST